MEQEKEENTKASILREILDDPMLLLFLGVAVYIIFYVIWGIMEVSQVSEMPAQIKQIFLTQGR